MQKSLCRLKNLFASLIFLTLFLNSASLWAQKPDYAAERERAIQLVNEKKYAEALPLFERLAADKQADGQIFIGLGISYWQGQETIKDKAQWKQIRLKARNAFLKAKELGVIIPEIESILAFIKPDGGDKRASDNPQAQAAMDEAFSAFAARDYQKAVTAYEKAATLDPTLYEAALYTGNSYYALKDYDKAGIWFARAIAIDPNRETAYRYWGDGLMLSGKNKEAEDKFFDAIIAEPYSSNSWRGLSQYAQRNKIQLAHPKIEIPVNVSSSGSGNTNITLGTEGKDDQSSAAWLAYALNRGSWRTGNDGKLSKDFSKAYPAEKVYRHSLAEEVQAFKMTLTVLKENKNIKQLSPSLTMLKRLNDDGLLEAFILFARADAGVRQDYSAYRQANRDKLKRYLAEYVVKNGGN